jgi:hypothetical protein
MQVSKSQIRAANLLGVDVDPINDEYPELAARLEAADIAGDGIPAGHTWRSAAKLADAELVKLLREDRDLLDMPMSPDCW